MVFHMFVQPRNNVGFPVSGGYSSDETRDRAMTFISDEDIAWIRPGRENSGTARNLQRRKEMNESSSQPGDKVTAV